MAWFADHAWLAWVGVALALGAIELASVDFVFLMLAGGALAGALAAGLGAPVAARCSSRWPWPPLALLLVRPVIKRQFTVPDAAGHRHRGPDRPLGAGPLRPSPRTTVASSSAVRPGRPGPPPTPPRAYPGKRSGWCPSTGPPRSSTRRPGRPVGTRGRHPREPLDD